MSLLKERDNLAETNLVAETATETALNIDFSASKSITKERAPEGHESLIADLSSALDPRDRTFAAMSLGYLGDPKVIPALEMAVLTRSENIFVLEAALRSIAQYGPAAAHSHLSVSRIINHDSAIVRLAAVQAIDSFKLEPNVIFSVLSGRFMDPALSVRREVAKIMDELPAENLREILPKAIHLLEIGEGDKRLVAHLMSIIEKAGKESVEGISAVRQRLRDCEPDIRIKAAQALGRMGQSVKVAAIDLYGVVGNPLEEISLRRECAVALRVHRLYDEDFLMDLGRVIEEDILENQPRKINEILFLKREIIELLGDFGPKASKAAPYLREALKSEEPTLIVPAAEALARLEALEVLIDALNSTDILVMQSIADAIKGMVYKMKHSKRARLMALLKLKFAWVKEPHLLDSIMALLRTLEMIEQTERLNNPELFQAPVDFTMPLQA